MFYQLPPVGNPVELRDESRSPSSLNEFFSPYLQQYYASGTAALAAAITAAIRVKGIDQPEVVLPAYGCPDLISAAVYAGAKPVLVDLEADRPWMNLKQVRSRVDSSTVAIVAANLFGVSERMIELRSVADQAGALLIEDSAQAFPGEGESDIWKGDLVVLSFGRGKPVSLLGGGAVLYRESALGDLLPVAGAQPHAGMAGSIAFHLKAWLYNRMISPGLYWLPQSLPFLNLGRTIYYPLTDIVAMDPKKLVLLPANITAYQKNTNEVQIALAEMLEKLDLAAANVIDLAKTCLIPGERRLLRYPLLVAASIRDPLYEQCKRSGTGPSRMYPAALPGIAGLEDVLAGQGPFPAAELFAARILTLPTHSRVSTKDIANIRTALNSI